MAFGAERFALSGPLGDLVVRAVLDTERPLRPVGEGLPLVRRVISELRFRLDAGDEPLAEATQRTLAELDRTRTAPRRLDTQADSPGFLGALFRELETALLAGRLVVEASKVPSLTERPNRPLPELPPLPRAPPDPGTHNFEVRFVDEIGSAISGVDAEFDADGPATRATNAAGIATLDGVDASSATVSLLDAGALEKVLAPRWEKFRPGTPAKEANLQQVVFRRGELGPFGLRAELPNTVVITPPLGKLFAQLFDKSGRSVHGERSFTIKGPRNLSGETAEDGLLLFEDLLQGDYTLSLTIESFKGDPDEVVEVVETPLVLLASAAAEPQLRMLGAVPRSILARMRMFFNTNKAFLLPTALPSMQKLRRLYVENAPCELLVVGHADTTGGAAFNDKLSLERAEATIAYLKDDVEAWFKFYGDGDPKKAWGKLEDRLMIISMPDFTTKPKGENDVKWFQRTRGLDIDGKAGTDTRHALIEEYMSLDGTSLADFVGEITATAHGCGENFPLDDSGELDENPEDEKRDPGDRRVELFFFDPEFGISPKPASENSAAGSPEYPKWRERVSAELELEEDDPDAPRVVFVELADAHFRTSSAVVLPEGENPDEVGDHEALTSVGLIATALRFSEDHRNRSLLVAGHTDTAGDAGFNKPLSEERAEVALTMLKGGDASRERFKTLCDARHTVADINQILSWAANAIPGFDCDPGEIDDQEHPDEVKKFQTAYNTNKSSLNPDAKVEPLKVDGAVGKLTWGAIFDCYELALRDELGEDRKALAELRAKLRFADDEHQFLGFGEAFPIEELGVDQFRSQTNRRIEILFFEPGEEPDLDHAASDPTTSELYLPGIYEREPVSISSAKRRELKLEIIDHQGFAVANSAVTLFLSDGSTAEAFTDDDGILTQKVPLGIVSVQLADGRFAHFGDEYVKYEHDPVTDLKNFPAESEGALSGNDGLVSSSDDHNASMEAFAELDLDLLP